jgi:hypothetical protein
MSNLDQSTTVDTSLSLGGAPECLQTFTAGRSGLLSGVDLYFEMTEPSAATVYLASENEASTLTLGIADPETQPGWYHVRFGAPYEVKAGTHYAIVVQFDDMGRIYGSSDTYGGGQALGWNGTAFAPIDGVSEFAFRTYVDTANTAVAWSTSQITAGTDTSLSLTETFTFANGPEAIGYKVDLGTLPAWFKPTAVTCSWSTAPTDCSLSLIGSGLPAITPNNAGEVETVTLSGTADPSAAGSTSVTGEGCLSYQWSPGGGSPDVDLGCGDGTGTIAVVAAAATPVPTTAATPPPTSIAPGYPRDDGGDALLILLTSVLAGLGCLAVLWDRELTRGHRGA